MADITLIGVSLNLLCHSRNDSLHKCSASKSLNELEKGSWIVYLFKWPQQGWTPNCLLNGYSDGRYRMATVAVISICFSLTHSPCVEVIHKLPFQCLLHWELLPTKTARVLSSVHVVCAYPAEHMVCWNSFQYLTNARHCSVTLIVCDPDWVHVQNMEQLLAHHCHQATESQHRICGWSSLACTPHTAYTLFLVDKPLFTSVNYVAN